MSVEIRDSKRKAIFLTHKSYLYSDITGGVQLCSQEFHALINSIGDIALQDFYVPYTKNWIQRLSIKVGMDDYSVFDVSKEAPALLDLIEKQKIEIVFINMPALVRFAKPLKKKFGRAVKIVLLSHGNYSGDFLHLITKPVHHTSGFRQRLNKIRLGNLISTEAEYRVKWLDGVATLSETEKQIENWFGAKRSSFLPRKLYKDFLNRVPVEGRIGFVGRLDHPPNYQGVILFLEELAKTEHGLHFRLIGAPPSYGLKLKQQFPFIEYLGELSDLELEEEVATWAFFLNPVWWYSTGASTKLGRAISWGLPIITTTAGMRGYEWKKGNLLVADNPAEMVRLLIREAKSSESIRYWREQTELIAENGPGLEDLVNRMKYTYE
jgi:glycosyltransferase involved in cell wall biosynthesis